MKQVLWYFKTGAYTLLLKIYRVAGDKKGEKTVCNQKWWKRAFSLSAMKCRWDLVFGRWFHPWIHRVKYIIQKRLLSNLRSYTYSVEYETAFKWKEWIIMTLMYGVWRMTYGEWWLVTDMKSVPKFFQIWWTHVPNFDEINNFYANIVVKIGVSKPKAREYAANMSPAHCIWLNDFQEIEKLF